MRVLAGDIGGTKTLLALLERQPDGGLRVLVRARYESARHPGLGPIVRDFLARPDVAAIDRAGFGVAGPVVDEPAPPPAEPPAEPPPTVTDTVPSAGDASPGVESSLVGLYEVALSVMTTVGITSAMPPASM